ncbi:type II secretion system secretin GspD [Brevundimonas sp.]|uniref:type II secretion system secretin GspD n=1 Tax=Brevundimonas sp. TaxID=1871086 RepID=UPI001DA874B7|nr:type II secretion system secretin GspD [Brevundimonas sp.]MBA4000952.1 type II secretion system protein GspD [Brevundimonas sp.]
MIAGANRILALAAAVVIGASGPLGAAAPALAQSSPRQTLNVQGADIRAFIQDIARTTGHTFIVDPRVTGTVTVTSDRALSRSELFEVFLSTLRANGLVVSPTASGAYRVSPAEGAAQGPSTVGSERFATEVFQIANIDAASAAEVVRPLVGAQGQVLANPRGNTLVVADFADNLRRIRSLISQIDVDRSAYEVVTLRNSSAREIARVVNEVLTPPGGGSAGMVSVVPVESSNSIVLRGDPAAVARIRPLVDDLDRRAESADDVRVVFLEHADAEQLLPVLQQMTGQISRPLDGVQSASAEGDPSATSAATPGARANIARFPGANALVIAAAPETQRMLSEVIRQLDTRRQQVLVEAIVVEVSDDAARALGVQWALAGRDGNPLFATNYSNTAPRILPVLGAIAGERELDEDDPLLEDLRGAALNSLLGANGVLGMGGGRIGSDGLFGAIINAVRSDEGSNLLSTPSLMTLDNEEATILVGQEVPVVVGEVLGSNNTNPFRTTQRQDIGVKLEVRPQINAGGAITLFLRQEVSSINGVLTAGASDLVLNKREIQTTVLVDDGQIAVLGGLLDQNERLSVESVPGLGDIPVIGNLFRSTARQRGQTNLMIFIRPTIIRSPGDAARVGAERWDYMRGRQIDRDPTVEPSLDMLIRDYMGGYRPAAPVPGGDVISPVGMTPGPVEGAPLPPPGG